MLEHERVHVGTHETAVRVFGRAPDWPLVAVSSAITMALFAASFSAFKRMDKYFADVI